MGGTSGLIPSEEEKAFQAKGTNMKGAPVRTQQEQAGGPQEEVKWGQSGRLPLPGSHQLTEAPSGPRRCGVRGHQLNCPGQEFPPLGNGCDNSHSNGNDKSER